MAQSIIGVHVAMFTDARILASAAYGEFRFYGNGKPEQKGVRDLGEVQRVWEGIFGETLEDPELLTPYSWRRVLPTMGPLQTFARREIGRPRPRSQQMQVWRCAIPRLAMVHGQSVRTKLLSTPIAHPCEGHSFWEEVLPEDLESFKAEASTQVNAAVSRERETVYAAQPTK